MKRLLVSIVVTLGFSGTASSEQITFFFDMQVTSVVSDVVNTGTQVGDVISGSYTFESTAPLTDVANGLYIYGTAITDFSMEIGDFSYSMVAQPGLLGMRIQVANAESGEGQHRDIYTVAIDVQDSTTCIPMSTGNAFGFILASDGASSLTQGNTIPTTPPDPSLADGVNRAGLTLNCLGGQVEIWAELIALSIDAPPPPASLEEQLEDLSELVLTINNAAGIPNALDSKLSSTLMAIDDSNANNDGAALNSMYAFCSNVEAQRGNKLTDAFADDLIAAANGIILTLDEFATPCSL